MRLVKNLVLFRKSTSHGGPTRKQQRCPEAKVKLQQQDRHEGKDEGRNSRRGRRTHP